MTTTLIFAADGAGAPPEIIRKGDRIKFRHPVSKRLIQRLVIGKVYDSGRPIVQLDGGVVAVSMVLEVEQK